MSSVAVSIEHMPAREFARRLQPQNRPIGVSRRSTSRECLCEPFQNRKWTSQLCYRLPHTWTSALTSRPRIVLLVRAPITHVYLALPCAEFVNARMLLMHSLTCHLWRSLSLCSFQKFLHPANNVSCFLRIEDRTYLYAYSLARPTTLQSYPQRSCLLQ